jgi:aminopeptidase-like protein
MTLAELRPHLHALPDRPDWIPYRTSYYDASLGLLPQPARARRAADGTTTSVSTPRSRPAT